MITKSNIITDPELITIADEILEKNNVIPYNRNDPLALTNPINIVEINPTPNPEKENVFQIPQNRQKNNSNFPLQQTSMREQLIASTIQAQMHLIKHQLDLLRNQ